VDFTLERYHHYVNDDIHLKIARIIQPGWDVDTFPVDFNLINERVSELVEKDVNSTAIHLGINNFFLKIVRPSKFYDNNQLHKDVWLDRLRNAINVYVPIVGSDINSSLPLIPGSHLAMESELERTTDGAFLNETKIPVPCVISYKGSQPKSIRPEVRENEIMVFSPYLVHGGGYNFNTDKTRVSLEVRFWKK
jgi:ectoine hydroxylase-related dioxygenase (phytanoyl-CoA dioxygenase family)